jgi:hypothetical protein
MTKKTFTVSVHIPKTAGTTVAEVFSRCRNKRVIFDYDGYQSPLSPSEIVVKNAGFIKEYFDVIHGHFYARKYFDLFSDAAFVSTLRHPVDRVISQFMHELNEESDDAMYHHDVQSGKMDVVEFASQPGIGDAMARHLEGKALKDYDLLIITEDLTRSLQLYSQTISKLALGFHFGDTIEIPVTNQGKLRKNNITFDIATRRAIFEKTKEDNAVYAEAYSLHERKLQALGAGAGK